jgi:hypothetical protein
VSAAGDSTTLHALVCCRRCITLGRSGLDWTLLVRRLLRPLRGFPLDSNNLRPPLLPDDAVARLLVLLWRSRSELLRRLWRNDEAIGTLRLRVAVRCAEVNERVRE